MQKIDVNWRELNDLSERTKINAEEFATEINKLIEITESLSDCWQGIDAENYKITSKAYYEKLKEDKNYLEQWSNLFKTSALKYNGGVEDGLTKVKQVNQTILDPNVLKDGGIIGE